MSCELAFTDEQRALIRAEQSLYVEACPGAGKTQAVVQRFIEQADREPRRGVGLVSFTNAVIDEARARCAGRPDLLAPPNFTGTLDSFINRFIVGPVFTSRTGVAPAFRSTWQQVAGGVVAVQGVRGQFPMDWFRFSDENAQLDVTVVPGARRYGVQALTAWQRRKVEVEAHRRWTVYLANGVMDAASARSLMRSYLADQATREQLADIMSARFFEIIVDEVQDCCDEEVQLLDFLLQCGVRLVLVGDPDQAIYGFRGASSPNLDAVRQAVTTGRRLNGNFRSTPAICKAVDSLRAGPATDVAVGPNAAMPHPVVVLRYAQERAVRQQLEAVVRSYGYDTEQLVILAHATTKARQCAGGAAQTGSSESKLVQLALLIHEVRSEVKSGHLRRNALSLLSGQLLRLAPGGGTDVPDPNLVEMFGLSARGFQERCLRLVAAVDDPFTGTPGDFKQRLGVVLRELHLGQISLSGLRTPTGDAWPVRPASDASALPYATVHNYKGLQQPVVALIVPEQRAADEDDGIRAWCGGRGSEARNVLYVGASRAEQLLILVIHESVSDDVEAVLSRDGVPFVLAEL
jgi:DNA helicase-2/ATP-dependent DNA helicase PcrA